MIVSKKSFLCDRHFHFDGRKFSVSDDSNRWIKWL